MSVNLIIFEAPGPTPPAALAAVLSAVALIHILSPDPCLGSNHLRLIQRQNKAYDFRPWRFGWLEYAFSAERRNWWKQVLGIMRGNWSESSGFHLFPGRYEEFIFLTNCLRIVGFAMEEAISVGSAEEDLNVDITLGNGTDVTRGPKHVRCWWHCCWSVLEAPLRGGDYGIILTLKVR